MMPPQLLQRVHAKSVIAILVFGAILLALIPDVYLLLYSQLPVSPTSNVELHAYGDKTICVDLRHYGSVGLNGILTQHNFKTRVFLDNQPLPSSQLTFTDYAGFDLLQADGLVMCVPEPLPQGEHQLQIIFIYDFGNFPISVTNFTVLPDGTIQVE